MARKYHEIKGLAEFTAKRIVENERQWMDFLDSAARMYKYPFKEQMLIYAQRPDATACAPLEIWNEKMNCWVNKGAKGIALIDEDGIHRSGLKYVFDVKDVHESMYIGHKPKLWKMREEHRDAVIDALEKVYGETGPGSFEDRVKQIAGRIAEEVAPDIVKEQLSKAMDGSFLEDFDDLNLELRLRDTMQNSITYAVLSRCGYSRDEIADITDFPYIRQFNTIDSLAVMGTMSSEMTEPVLREVGKAIGAYNRNKALEELKTSKEEKLDRYIDSFFQNAEKGLANGSDARYNALTRESAERVNEHIGSAEKSAERSEYEDRLHNERGLSDPEPDSQQRAGEVTHEVRSYEAELLEGAQERDIQRNGSEGDIENTLSVDTGSGRTEDGSSDRADGEGTGRGRADEEKRSDALGRSDEQHTELSGGDGFIGADLQLKQTPEIDKTGAENFHITDDRLGVGGPKEKFRRNIAAIETLQKIESENRIATPEEQQILSQYVGWGGLSDAFDDTKSNSKCVADLSIDSLGAI